MPGVYAFLTGLSAVFTAFSVSEKSILLFLIFTLAGAFTVSLQKEKVLKITGVIIFIIVFLRASAGFSMLNLPLIPDAMNGKEITLTAKAGDFSKQTIRPNSFRISQIEVNSKKFSGNAKVYCGMNEPPPPYSTVKIKGKIRIYEQNGIIRKLNGTSYIIYASSIEILRKNSLMSIFSKMRSRIARNTLLSMKSSEGMLLLSSVSGISAMNYTEKIPFQKTGTSHIFAVSGLHMGILGESSEKILSFAGNFGSVSTVAILFLFVLLVGFRASALRAFLMFTVSEIAKLSGKEQIPINTLAFTGLILLLINPLITLSVSFQLSFAAIFALIILSPKLYELMPKKSIFKMLSQVISVQLILYPIIAYYFHTFSPVSFLANLLVIPFMYIVLPIGIIQITLSLVSFRMAKIFAPVSNFIFHILYKTTVLFARIPYSNLNIRFNATFMLIYFAALLIFLLSIQNKNTKIKIISTVLLSLAILLPMFPKQGFSIIPLKLSGEDGFIIENGGQTIYITSTTTLENEEADTYKIKECLADNGINRISLMICNTPLKNKESSALQILPHQFKIPDIIMPSPETELSDAFARTNYPHSKVHYYSEKTTVSVKDLKIKFIKSGIKYAVFIDKNGTTFLIIGKGCKNNGNFPYADFVFAPSNFNASNLLFGKLQPY